MAENIHESVRKHYGKKSLLVEANKGLASIRDEVVKVIKALSKVEGKDGEHDGLEAFQILKGRELNTSLVSLDGHEITDTIRAEKEGMKLFYPSSYSSVFSKYSTLVENPYGRIVTLSSAREALKDYKRERLDLLRKEQADFGKDNSEFNDFFVLLKDMIGRLANLERTVGGRGEFNNSRSRQEMKEDGSIIYFYLPTSSGQLRGSLTKEKNRIRLKSKGVENPWKKYTKNGYIDFRGLRRGLKEYEEYWLSGPLGGND